MMSVTSLFKQSKKIKERSLLNNKKSAGPLMALTVVFGKASIGKGFYRGYTVTHNCNQSGPLGTTEAVSPRQLLPV